MLVSSYTKFAAFEYVNVESPHVKLGEVWINEHNEVGVVIQTHGDDEFRTDMSGNICLSRSRRATMEEVTLYRPGLLPWIDISSLAPSANVSCKEASVG